MPRGASAGEPVQLIVDTSTLAESDREHLRATILESVSEALAAEGHEAVDAAPTTLRVRIQYLDEENLDYTIFYDVLRDAELVGEAHSLTCSGCVDAKLVRTIGEGLPTALARIDELAEAETEQEEDPQSEPPDDVPVAARVAPIGALGIVGTVLAAGGIATLVVGGLELPKPKEFIPPLGLEGEFRDHARTGRVLLATGASVLVVGVAMLATDVALRSKRNRAATSKVARVPAPLLAPGFVGVGLSGRF